MREIKDCWHSTEAQNRQTKLNSREGILSRHRKRGWAEGGAIAKSSVLPLDAT